MESDKICSICLDHFQDGKPVKVLPCNHPFHPSCVDGWLSEHSTSCPLCRADLGHQAGSGNNSDDEMAGVVVLIIIN